jgi:hypothetical protein
MCSEWKQQLGPTPVLPAVRTQPYTSGVTAALHFGYRKRGLFRATKKLYDASSLKCTRVDA